MENAQTKTYWAVAEGPDSKQVESGHEMRKDGFKALAKYWAIQGRKEQAKLGMLWRQIDLNRNFVCFS